MIDLHPETLSKNPAFGVKNRVGDIFCKTGNRVRNFESNPSVYAGENRIYSYGACRGVSLQQERQRLCNEAKDKLKEQGFYGNENEWDNPQDALIAATIAAGMMTGQNNWEYGSYVRATECKKSCGNRLIKLIES